MFANCAIALGGGGSSWLGGGKYWQFVQGILGGSSHFVRGMGTLFSYFYLFLIFLSTGVGLGIGLIWLNRVEPSLTQWITGGVLHKMGGAGFCLFFSSYAGRYHLIEYLVLNLCPVHRKEIAIVLG